MGASVDVRNVEAALGLASASLVSRKSGLGSWGSHRCWCRAMPSTLIPSPGSWLCSFLAVPRKPWMVDAPRGLVSGPFGPRAPRVLVLVCRRPGRAAGLPWCSTPLCCLGRPCLASYGGGARWCP
ncbi:hypothetical protein NDU88_006032 [Pleurodeles waltl]|uniref:Uncharacterized protein n=1 Tax=Pleurodeles waltl TaxID=8319 RepID=A0AAV7UKC8_PLEWA|nr:hypothetical protein NDU88_006032 [Pleurodeles waltl]